MKNSWQNNYLGGLLEIQDLHELRDLVPLPSLASSLKIPSMCQPWETCYSPNIPPCFGTYLQTHLSVLPPFCPAPSSPKFITLVGGGQILSSLWSLPRSPKTEEKALPSGYTQHNPSYSQHLSSQTELSVHSYLLHETGSGSFLLSVLPVPGAGPTTEKVSANRCEQVWINKHRNYWLYLGKPEHQNQ